MYVYRNINNYVLIIDEIRGYKVERELRRV